MKTPQHAGFLLRLVCLMVALFGVSPKGVAGDTYDPVIVSFRLSTERPDPREPFTMSKGSNGETASSGPDLHLLDPRAQINNSSTRVYVSMRLKFRSRDAAHQWVAIKQPNITNLAFTFMGRKYRDGYNPQSVGGAFNILASDSLYTSVTDPNPNPTTGRAWIYALKDGSMVTTPGAKVKLTAADGAVTLNPGNGDFLIHPDPNFAIDELWIVGAEQSFSAGFITAYNGAASLWQAVRIPFELVAEVTNSVIIEGRLNALNGCRTTVQYDAFRIPAVYCGTHLGAVRPTVELSKDTRQLVLTRCHLGDRVVQSSVDEVNWSAVTPGYVFVPPLDFFNEDRRGMTIALPDWSQISHPPPKRMMYRLWSAKAPEPPVLLSR